MTTPEMTRPKTLLDLSCSWTSHKDQGPHALIEAAELGGREMAGLVSRHEIALTPGRDYPASMEVSNA